MHCMKNMTKENHRIMATLEALVITALLTLGSIGVSGNTGELSTTTGETVLIPCDFGEGTVRNLYWYYNDGTGPVKILTLFRGNYYVKLSIDAAYDNRASLHDDSSTLILTDITVKDEGTYRCDVEREGQTAVPNINTKLNVFSLTPDTLPEITECTDVDCIIYSNKSITITCLLRNVYPVEDAKLIWYQEGQFVTSPNNLTLNDDGTIDMIRPIQVSESGNLTCNASFLTTQGAENAAVTVGVWITTEPGNTPRKKLTIGQTAGIVVCALAVPLLVIALFYIKRRKKNKNQNVAETVPFITSNNCIDVVEQPELTLLTKKFPAGKFYQFCFELDWGYNDANQVLIKHSNDCEKALLEILITWKTRTGGHRSVLQNALLEAGVGGLLPNIAGEKTETHSLLETTNDAGPKEEQSSLIQGLDKTTHSSSSQTVPNPKQESNMDRSGKREVTSEEITRLARILPESKFCELFNALGFDYNYHTQILEKHHMDISAATADLLEQWKEKTPGYTDVLDKAIEKAGVGRLIPKYKKRLEDSNIQSHSSSSQTVPNPKQESNMDRSGRRKVTSEEIIRLARILPESKFSKLFNALVFDGNYRTKILKNHHMDISAATADLLEQWKAEAYGYMDVLDEALKKAEVGRLIPKYKQVLEGISQSQPSNSMNGETKEHTASNSSLPKASSGKQECNLDRSGKRAVMSEEITELAKLLPEGKFIHLFNALELGYSYHQRILKKHHLDNTAAAEELLEEWKTKTHGYTDVLDKAIEKAEVGGLIPKYKKVLEGSN